MIIQCLAPISKVENTPSLKETSIQSIPSVPKTKLSTTWYPNSLGPKKLDQLQYIGQTPSKYVHINMNLNRSEERRVGKECRL